VALQAGLSIQLATHPDATLDEHCRMWEAEHGMKVSSATMSRAIKCLHWTRKKKTLSASEQNKEARAAWRESVSDHKSDQLVFIDEYGSNIGLTRLMARAPRGQRAYGKVPRNRGKSTTLIASLSLGGIGEAIILEGATQTAAFEHYVEHILGPNLELGQIVVMDTLRVHKGERVRQIIEARGCHVLFLPAYSPDFSPIEEAFSKRKAFLRKVGVRTREDLQEVLIKARGNNYSPRCGIGWFRHCGYPPPEARLVITLFDDSFFSLATVARLANGERCVLTN
jgi:transposase